MSASGEGEKGGGVRDLAARRMQQVAEENRQLRDYVAGIMARLRENEQLFSRLFELEREVLAARDPEDLCFLLLRGLRARFELDFVRFWFERSGVVGGHSMAALSERDLVWIERDEIRQMGLAQRPVSLLRITPERGFDWLQSYDSRVASLALLTLGAPERPFGVLGIGSADENRFAPDQGTDFLQHLAQVVGLSLENAVTRQRLARLSMTDGLTGCYTRRFLQPHSRQPLSQWFGEGEQVACLYLDVDQAASVNEAGGESAGDDLLGRVADAARGEVRARDPLIRMSGDEFALLLPGCGPEKAREIGERVVAACGRIESESGLLSVSVGLGFSAADEDRRVNELIEEADRGMYIAKALGGGRCESGREERDDAPPA